MTTNTHCVASYPSAHADPSRLKQAEIFFLNSKTLPLFNAAMAEL
jgi:hypothetical protein